MELKAWGRLLVGQHPGGQRHANETTAPDNPSVVPLSVSCIEGGLLRSVIDFITYVVRYDPNPKIKETMKEMWRNLVKDPAAAIDAAFSQIIEDLLKSMGSRQFRIRFSSNSALADLLQGRDFAQVKPWLERIWINTFRTLDDINDGVDSLSVSCFSWSS